MGGKTNDDTPNKNRTHHSIYSLRYQLQEREKELTHKRMHANFSCMSFSRFCELFHNNWKGFSIFNHLIHGTHILIFEKFLVIKLFTYAISHYLQIVILFYEDIYYSRAFP